MVLTGFYFLNGFNKKKFDPKTVRNFSFKTLKVKIFKETRLQSFLILVITC